jgi:hypothetical protein
MNDFPITWEQVPGYRHLYRRRGRDRIMEAIPNRGRPTEMIEQALKAVRTGKDTCMNG